MDNKFSKIEKASLKEQVICELEKKILSRDLKPGDRLPPERELAAALGISRSLVNLCILELESRGFVRIVPRQGTFVNDYKKHGTLQILVSLMNYDSDRMDMTLFDNMMDTRRLIEGESVKLAIDNASDDELELIKKEFKLMEEAKNKDQFINANFRFHHALISASGNAIYAMIFNSFEHAVIFLFNIFFCDEKRIYESIDTHRLLLDALFKRNYEAAYDAIQRTFDIGIAGLSDVFKK